MAEAPGGRVLYLDTDVVVRADLLPLATRELHGAPAGVAEDCSQRVGALATCYTAIYSAIYNYIYG